MQGARAVKCFVAFATTVSTLQLASVLRVSTHRAARMNDFDP